MNTLNSLAAVAPSLPEALACYVREAISPNTRRAYLSDLRHFEQWGGTVPCSPEVVATYLSEQTERVAIATITRRLAALKAAHAAKGFASPTDAPLVKASLRGIRRVHGRPARQVKPLLLEDLFRAMSTIGASPKDVRDRALLLIGFAGGFRRSELVALNVGDIDLGRQGASIALRRSKTDQFGDGRIVGIPFARGIHCPVRALEAWLSVAEIADGAVFRSVSRGGKVLGNRLSGEAVSHIVKARVSAIGLSPAGYSGHSLRAGLCTSAAAAGLSSLAIRQQTGHRSDQMLARYVRAGELFTNNVAGALL